MQRLMLKSKIHRAVITGTALDYTGSITVDENLLAKADILPGEQVHVLNVNAGHRFITYAIAASRGSHSVVLNGPAARLGQAGDRVIIVAYCVISDQDSRDHKPRVLFVNEDNQVQGETRARVTSH